ncbi:hemicentin-1-like isoform X2 [Choristoneura fumiferana]|uniref:hemicentin-1-like isoform X2 n=1 Tax=Choristoneura fumiferana TaxID=7141 RepID=UPI003D15C2C2
MDAKYIFWLTFLVAQASCEQKKSLTFVIDSTISMKDDITHVRKAAKSIMDIVLKEKSSQIEDIVLVIFRDPGWEFRKRTRDEAELKKALDDINLIGNWDCPEMCLSGIKMGLEQSQPGSFLYVFTDASAKDYKKFDEIKNLCQEKQIQVVFVLTGDCGDFGSPKSQVYYKIAAASNGQVFRISKGEVGQIFDYVKETIKGDMTVITSEVVPPHKWYTVHFNIDDKTEYALVSASGFNVQLKIRNQFKKKVRGIEVTWTKNVKALKLVGLRPGAYKAFVHGSSDVNVMIFGRTDFNFNFGFSNKTENSLKYTEAQPTQGTTTHLIISVKDDEHSVNIQNVEILDMNERVIQRLPLTNVGGSVYATTKFLPPNAMFKVAVTATARSTGKAIRRIANTPVEPIKPVVVKPEISDTEKILKAKEGEKVNIHCRIRRGKPKPHITWYFRQRGASQFKLLPGKADDVLLMNNVLVRDTGDYQCVAENIAGRATHIVQLEVFGLPAFEKSPSVLEVRQSANLDIQCKIRSGNPPPAITWQFKTSETGEYHNIDNFGELLRIFNVQQSNSGFYKCEAKNNIGTTQQIAQVIVLVNPEFEDTPAKITEKENAPVTLMCKLRKGNPRPKITWYFQASGSKIFTTLSNNGEELRLPAVQVKDSGEYRCVAENSAGRGVRTMMVTVLVRPEISDTEKILKAKEGEKVNIHCRIRRGKPKPHITWYFRQRGASQFKLLPGKTDDVLLMNNVLVRDTGDYQCVAENIAGRATHKVQLEVFGLPAFEKSPSVLKVRQSANLDIQCKIRSGNPPPAITWQFKTSETGEYHNIDNFGELLRIFNVQQSNSGFYKCEAKNNIGTTQQIAQVIVLVNPEFEDTPAKITEKENAPVTLKCKLRKGNPRPKITWYFQASGSKHFTTLSNSGEELRLPAVQLKDSGEYRCVAENSAGRDERTMTVTVLAAPEIERSTPSIIRVKENTTISIPCRLSNGFPKPTITWWYMDANSTEYAAIPDSNADFLHLEHIQLTKAGHYKCVARNTVGHTDKDVQIIVEAPARIVFIPPNSPFYEGVEGDVVMRLPCTAVGFPKPSVSWIVDQDVVGKDKSRSLYVEDDVFYLKNPQRFNSSNYSKNITHTYVCHAVNDFGKDKQSYEVTVLQYADYESNNTDEKYAEAKKPYDLNCPLPYTDPNSVRWFYDLTIMNKTGPILHFDDPTRANSGNYTCRVSDLNGAASYTIELKFDYPPSVSRLVYEAEWNGNEEEITCNAEILYGKYEWFYRGVKVKEAYDDKLELSLIGWGQYVCRVTNPLGTLNITYNIHAKDCIIEKNLSKTKNLPLVLDMSLAWPTFHRQNQYQIIPKSEKFTFICQDDWPKSKSYSQSESNSFMKFPNTKSIIATCDHEDLFLVDGVTYKLSELDCKHEVSSSVVPIKECLGSDTTMMSVGFNVNGFLDVYKSCLDTKRNVVLFTEVITTGADQFGYTDKPERPCESIEECCYESVQLVNAADVSAGPAEKATFGKPLNTVSYCKPNDENTTSWHDIETKVREKASQSRLMIWSGTVNYTTVDKLLVPQYLWKVVKDLDNEEILTIVHSNEQAPQASLCESVCQKSWFEPYGPRTYCCRLEEFKKVFNLTINF